ncbi:hypothetical protein [Shimia biformata]|uniref:hypothetical protein n=1 Tax=Shimia biformata TaxID=1294299 RepID=UPI00194F6364|nr:hypothetical protein [Shimia biformata]
MDILLRTTLPLSIPAAKRDPRAENGLNAGLARGHVTAPDIDQLDAARRQHGKTVG